MRRVCLIFALVLCCYAEAQREDRKGEKTTGRSRSKANVFKHSGEGCSYDRNMGESALRRRRRKLSSKSTKGCVQSPSPTESPTTEFPTISPTDTPTAAPTAAPTANPTNDPTANPTNDPTATPTAAPTASPTAAPTANPTTTPTAVPTSIPTVVPTAVPTAIPTTVPTAIPTNTPTTVPSPLTTLTLQGTFSKIGNRRGCQEQCPVGTAIRFPPTGGCDCETNDLQASHCEGSATTETILTEATLVPEEDVLFRYKLQAPGLGVGGDCLGIAECFEHVLRGGFRIDLSGTGYATTSKSEVTVTGHFGRMLVSFDGKEQSVAVTPDGAEADITVAIPVGTTIIEAVCGGYCGSCNSAIYVSEKL